MTKKQFYDLHVKKLAILCVLMILGMVASIFYPITSAIFLIVFSTISIRTIRNYELNWIKQQSKDRYERGCKVGPYETPNE